MGYVPPIKPEQADRYRNRVDSHQWRKVAPVERAAKTHPDKRPRQKRQERAGKGKTIDQTV